MLSEPTGLHHKDQKLMYKGKARDSKSYLDVAGVKDRSKMVVMEDPISQEKRFLEMRKNAKNEKAVKSISNISFEVDRLAGQVSAIGSVISKGGKVGEKTLLNVTELLMNQLLKLDGLTVDGDVKLLRKTQVKRIQEYVETLDALKLKNSTVGSIGGTTPPSKRMVMANRPHPPPPEVVATTTEWEIFDTLVGPTSRAATTNTMNPVFNWDLI